MSEQEKKLPESMISLTPKQNQILQSKKCCFYKKSFFRKRRDGGEEKNIEDFLLLLKRSGNGIKCLGNLLWKLKFF